MHNLSNREYHLLANHACQEIVEHLRVSQPQFYYKGFILFCQKFFFSITNATMQNKYIHIFYYNDHDFKF